MAISEQAKALLALIKADIAESVDIFKTPTRLADITFVSMQFKGNAQAFAAARDELIAAGTVRISESGCYLELI
ncbi:hypothetical protein [Burkholderia phage BCSR129]|nr:hypothetical protein [Burkholderia phage BCSR129]